MPKAALAAIVGAFTFIAGFTIAAALFHHASADPAPGPTVTVRSTVTWEPDTPIGASPAGKPTVVLNVSGVGTNTTKTFTVHGDWDLHYTYRCDYKDNMIVDASDGTQILNEVSTGRTDTTHQHGGAGPISLKVSSGCAWTLKAIQLPN